MARLSMDDLSHTENFSFSLKSRRLLADTQFARTQPSKYNHFIQTEVHRSVRTKTKFHVKITKDVRRYATDAVRRPNENDVIFDTSFEAFVFASRLYENVDAIIL